jgi:phosphoribosylformylglycinamidine synthase
MKPEDLIASGEVPKLDLGRERSVQNACLKAAEAGLLKSAHDCSDGGLAVAIAESCFSSLGRDSIGAKLDLGSELASTILLFSETPSRIIVTFDPADEVAVKLIAENNNAPFAILGSVGGSQLQITASGEKVVEAGVAQLESAWREGLENRLHADALAVV